MSAEQSLPDDTRDPNWRTKLLGARPTEAIGDLPVVRYVQVHMTPQVATLATQIGREQGMSRAHWIRKVVAEAICEARPGLTVEDLYPRMPMGRRNERHRPETRRET